MPKKQKIKTDAGLVLDAEQADMVRRQMYEGSYGLDAPDITLTDDDITVRVGGTVYTVYGDSPLHTTTVIRRSESSYTPAALGGDDVGYAVRDAIERTRDAALATIESVNEEWAANVGEFDDAEGDDEDEVLREGPVVGSGPLSESVWIAEAKRRIAHAEQVIRKCDAADAERDLITLPNSEYADILATARRDASFRAAFGNGLVTASNGGDGERPYLRVDFPTFEAALRAQGVLLRDSKCHAFERPVPDDVDAPAGEIDIPEFVAATTGSGTASDGSDASQGDGGSVEPELDIDALVAAADAQRDTCALDIRAVRSGEHPAMTVTATGPGTADLLGRIISNILDDRAFSAEVTLGVADYRPVEDDVGECASAAVDPVDAAAATAIEGAAPFTVSSDGATVSVDGPKVRLTCGGGVFEATAVASVFDELRKALVSAKNAGGFR